MAGIKDLKFAIEEAERFIDRATKAVEHSEGYRDAEGWKAKGAYQPDMWNASAKRASMDLTRALVYVRR